MKKLQLTIEFENLYELDAFLKRNEPTLDPRPGPIRDDRTPTEPVTFPITQRVIDDEAHAQGSIAERPDRNVVPPEGPTQEQMETAVKAYGKTHGLAAARSLLDEYTTGRIGTVPAEKRPELYARLTA